MAKTKKKAKVESGYQFKFTGIDSEGKKRTRTYQGLYKEGQEHFDRLKNELRNVKGKAINISNGLVWKLYRQEAA